MMLTESFHALTNCMNEAFILVAGNGEVIAANTTAVQLLETEISGMQGRNISDFLDEPLEKVADYIRICSASQSLIPVSFVWRCAGGRTLKLVTMGERIDFFFDSSSPYIFLRCEPVSRSKKGFNSSNSSISFRDEHLPDPDDDFTLREPAGEEPGVDDGLYRHAFSNAPVGMCVLDSSGRFLTVNKRFCQITGYSEEKLLDMCFTELTYPGDLPGSMLLFQNLIFGETDGYELEKRYVRADGRIIWVLIHISVVHGASLPFRAVAQVVDITTRKDSEAALQENRQLIDRILDTSTSMIWVIDGEGSFLLVNQAFADFVGTTKDNITGRPNTDIHPHLNADSSYMEMDHEVIRTGRTIAMEALCTRHDDEKAWWHVIKTPISQSDGTNNVLAIAMDITDRKNSEYALESAYSYNRSLIEASLDPLVTIGKDGRITDVNAATEQITGYDRNQLLGQDFSDFFTDSEAARAGYRYVFKEGLVRDYPLDIRHLDGRTTPVLYNASVYKDKEGNVIGVFAAARDITERKHAENEIIRLNAELEQRVSERTEQLTEALDESQHQRAEIAALLTASRAVLENREFPAAARVIFDSCANLIGATAYISLLSDDSSNNVVVIMESGGIECMVDPKLPITVRGLYGEVQLSGKTIFHNGFSASEWAETLPKGHIKLDNVLFAPLLIKNKVAGLFGLANKPGGFDEHDVHTASAFCEIAAVALHNSRSLELLESSEERFRSVAQSATDAIISINENGDISFWNKAAERIFGYETEDVIGNPLDSIMPQRYREEHQRRIRRAVETGETRVIGKVVNVVGLKKDGSEFPLGLSLSTWKTREGVFFTGIVRDDTERKQSEEAIRGLNEDLEQRATQLETANRELEAFSYSVSHDLRAPLRSIDGFSQALLEDCHDRLDEQGKDYLRRVRSASQRMAHLIDDMLKLSRITRSEMHFEEVDLAAIVVSVSEELRESQPSRTAEFAIHSVPLAWGGSAPPQGGARKPTGQRLEILRLT